MPDVSFAVVLDSQDRPSSRDSSQVRKQVGEKSTLTQELECHLEEDQTVHLPVTSELEEAVRTPVSVPFSTQQRGTISDRPDAHHLTDTAFIVEDSFESCEDILASRISTDTKVKDAAWLTRGVVDDSQSQENHALPHSSNYLSQLEYSGTPRSLAQLESRHSSREQSPLVKVRSWLEIESSSLDRLMNPIEESTIPSPERNEISSISKMPAVTRQHEISKLLQQHQRTRAQDAETTDVVEHVLPMRLTAIQRRLYSSSILKNASSIESFCDDPTSLTPRATVSQLLSDLQKIAIHPLLIADSLPETQMSENEEAWYLVQSSSKFELIAEMLETLRHDALRVAIFCDDERLLQIWGTVLQGLHVRYANATGESSQNGTQDESIGDLHVDLVPSDTQQLPGAAIDLAFSLDGRGRIKSAPNFILVAHQSIEHISRQIDDPVTLISTVAWFSETAGVGTQDTGASVLKIVDYLCGKSLIIEELGDVTFSSSQYDLVSYDASIEESPSKKRRLEHDELETPAAPEIVITHIDGLEVHTEAAPTSTTSSDPNAILSMSPQSTAMQPSGDALLTSVSEPETHPARQAQYVSPVNLERTPTQIYAEPKKEIWTKPSEDQKTIAKLEEDIERIMIRFDELREECRELAEQKNAALNQAAALQKRFERAIEEARNAKQDKNEVKMELDRLKMPPLPDESSPEFYQAETQRLKTELEKLRKSSDSKAQDFDFVRQQYQQSSSAAVELATENATLKAELDGFKNKSEGGLGYQSIMLQNEAVQAALREEAENLTLRNNVLIEQLRRMREERMAGRGRGEGRRDIAAVQDRKRATSASAEVGQRKKVEKLGTSRLSVASLISPTSDRINTAFDRTGSPKANLHQMLRGQSQDTRSFGRERVPAKRPRTPF